jgi:hypothetical protein
MTGRAPAAVAKALRDYGPSILSKPFVHGPASELRLQLAPDDLHNAEHDPHREGRALDIVLLAGNPVERAEADELVRLFRRMADTIQWGGLIYNKKEWTPSGAEMPRLFRPRNADEPAAVYAEKKAKFEHITHIHIEWPDHKKDLDDFADALVAELTSEEGDLLATMDGAAGDLPGAWDTTLNGSWTGVFKFTAAGGATWHSLAASPPGGTGNWEVSDNRTLSWKYGGGDIRTFTVDLPLDTSKCDGRILPEGQGWFTMTKRPP